MRWIILAVLLLAGCNESVLRSAQKPDKSLAWPRLEAVRKSLASKGLAGGPTNYTFDTRDIDIAWTCEDAPEAYSISVKMKPGGQLSHADMVTLLRSEFGSVERHLPLPARDVFNDSVGGAWDAFQRSSKHRGQASQDAQGWSAEATVQIVDKFCEASVRITKR